MSLLLTTAAMLLGAAPTAPAPAAPTDRHVVVISIDGLPGYLLDDPKASLPVIRKLRAEGIAAAKGMIVSNPSVTWPNHTTLMTGVHPDRHGVLFNGVLERQGPGKPVKVVPAKDQRELVRVPLLFDVLKEAGLSSAAINWPCTRGSKSAEDNFPDVPDQLVYTSRDVKDWLKETDLLARFPGGGGVVRDEVWTEVACRVIRQRKPRLMALHLLNLDSIHHGHGPRTAPGYTAAALADARIGQVLEAIDEAGIRDRTTVFVVSDHGFGAVEKSLRPNVVLRQKGFLAMEGNAVQSARAYVVPEGGTGMLYFTDPNITDAERETVKKLFAGAEGIAAVIEPKDYAQYHYPQPADDPHMADLVIAAKEGYTVSGSVTGDELVVANKSTTGSHGYLSTWPDMNATFVVAGAGVRAGTPLETIENIDLAPTVAKLLGVQLEGAAGKAREDLVTADATRAAAAGAIEVIAHRGESNDAPENTLAAFRMAWERHAPAVELDVHLTRDGHLIVSHDPDTKRTTGVEKVIQESTLEELRTLDAGRWLGPQWAGEKLPTLDEALATLPAQGRFFIEIKVGPEAIPPVAEAIRRTGRPDAQFVVISFNADTIAASRKQLPEIQAYFLSSFKQDKATGAWHPSASELIETAHRIGANGLNLAAKGPIDADFVHQVKAAGLGMFVWTINDQDVAERFAALGVDGITTNRSRDVQQWLGQTQAPAKTATAEAPGASRTPAAQ